MNFFRFTQGRRGPGSPDGRPPRGSSRHRTASAPWRGRGRIRVQVSEEARRRGLGEISGARVDLRGPHSASGKLQGDAGPHAGWVARRAPQADSDRVAAGRAVVAKGQRGGVVARANEVRPAVQVQVDHRERLRVAGHDHAARVGPDGGEPTAAVAAQQLAQAAVEPADGGDRRVGVLQGADVGTAVAVQVAGDESLERGNLRDPRQRLEPERAVGLAEERAAAKLRRREPPRCGEVRLAENFTERRAGIVVVPRVVLEHRGDHGAEVPAGAARVDAFPPRGRPRQAGARRRP